MTAEPKGQHRPLRVVSVYCESENGISGRNWEDVREDLPAADEAMSDDLQLLMAALRMERKRRGLTQQAVAKRMNVSQSRVSAIETGTLEATEVGTLARYLRALGARLRLNAEFEL
ncbi:helix-turn-helix domain-containing protein [Streptomyces sp. NPDC057757]|uniref:helix-turn-helix domain-containing protein n=1 Tax=Streptomyces sp. NPDC057757 TaxID=3346241 RepID=UPI00369641CF